MWPKKSKVPKICRKLQKGTECSRKKNQKYPKVAKGNQTETKGDKSSQKLQKVA